jgi:hypothetical protein
MAKSFNFYLSSNNPFFKYLSEVVSAADKINKLKLYSIFPAVVAATYLKSYDDEPKEHDDIINVIPENIRQYLPGDKNREQGSFGWYLINSGHFVTAMAKLITYSDDKNLSIIHHVYPQMIEAFKMSDWDKAPEGFDMCYDSYSDCENVISFKLKS